MSIKRSKFKRDCNFQYFEVITVSIKRDIEEMLDLKEELGVVKCGIMKGTDNDICVRGNCQLWNTRKEILEIRKIMKEKKESDNASQV